MKNLLILHGSYGNPHRNWYQYLRKQAEQKGYLVNIPQLPHTDKPSLEETYNFLLSQDIINSETVMVGHSSGATLILGILQKLAQNLIVNKAILIAGLVDTNLTDELFKVVPKSHYKKLFPQKWDWEKIKKNCRKFVIVHAPDDPYVQLRHAEFLKEKLGGELVIIPHAKHFSINAGGERFREFPELLPYLSE